MSLPGNSSTLPQVVLDHLAKAREACVAAVENYNKPGRAFRTRTYTILMVVAWTALFRAIFHRRGEKPWYVESGTGSRGKYKEIDGEPWHWDLAECVRHYYLGDNPPQRANLEFMVRLRNKIEHRDHPELDPALYGECQAMLMNFEELLTCEFGEHHAASGQLAVALQFSSLRPDAQEEALRRLQSSAATDLLDGAAVRVPLVCFSRSDDELTPERRLDGETADDSALRLITAVALRTTAVWSERRYLDLSLLEPKEVAKAA